MTRLDCLVQVTMPFPYAMALDDLQAACCLWNGRVITAGSRRPEAIIALPWPIFKKMFHVNPVPQILPVPNAMNKFVDKLEVKGFIIVELKEHAL